MPDKTSENKKNLIYMEDVYKIYGKKIVLDNVDLSISQGELCTVVGPSGCGKSTLLRLIIGQEKQTKGKLLIDGKPAGPPDPQRGIVYQRYSLFPNLTVLGNVMLGKQLSAKGFFERRRSEPIFRKEAEHFLEKVKLEEHLHKYPHQLSGGMQQRVALAQSLIMRPKILVMDEPFGALDPGTREEMQVFLSELWEEFDMTVFFVTHDLEEAVFLGTRIIVLSQFYSDDRGGNYKKHGSRIVADYPLKKEGSSTAVKETAEFGMLIQQVRREGFDPDYLQYVTDFNLRHSDSFQTIPEKKKD